jgi:SAM-dependent methyltransferase
MAMKLHDVVELQQELKELVPTQAIEAELNNIVNNISNIQGRYGEEYAYRLGLVITALNEVKASLQKPLEQVAIINDVVELDHKDATEKFSSPTYQSELHYQNPARIREVRQLYIPNGADEIVSQAIDLYVDWRYPGLEIGCRDGHWTKYMVGCDPLYVVDEFQEFLDSTKQGYPEEYQQRLRTYLTKDHNLSALPKGQFGFVFSWNYFNYLTLGNINKYLTQVFDLLRPGGTFMFSYNNADLPAPAAYADSYFMSYAPKHLLLPMCKAIGYEVVSTTDLEPAVSWVEIKRPGELKMIKAHQVLGEIKYASP